MYICMFYNFTMTCITCFFGCALFSAHQSRSPSQESLELEPKVGFADGSIFDPFSSGIVPYFESFLVRSTPSLPSEDLLCLVMSRCDRDLRQECLRVRLEWELQTSDAAAASASRATGSSTMLSKPHIPETQVLSWLAQPLGL